jgi:acetyl esterase/lipase
MAGHAVELGVDPARIIVMSKSGGGGVAAATALYARDHGGPVLAGQMLIAPMLDDRETIVSSRYDVPPWTRSINRIGWSAILGPDAGGPGVSPYAAPVRAQDLAGRPAAYLVVGSCEVFRDKTLDYATRLAQAGVPVELHCWQGGFHAFDILAPGAGVSRACLAAGNSYLIRALRASAPGADQGRSG